MTSPPSLGWASKWNPLRRLRSAVRTQLVLALVGVLDGVRVGSSNVLAEVFFLQLGSGVILTTTNQRAEPAV